jgi:hypothetical protein
VEMFYDGERTADTVSVAGFCHAGTGDQVRTSEEVRALAPAWSLAGLAVEGTLAGTPHLRKEIRRAQRVAFPGLGQWATKRGLVPYLPRYLGGLGLLRSTQLHREAPSRQIAHSLILFATNESASADHSMLERCWSYAGCSACMQWGLNAAEEAFEHSFAVIDRLTHPREPGTRGLEILEMGGNPVAAAGRTKCELLTAVAASQAVTLMSVGIPFTGKTWNVSPWRIAKTLRGRWEDLRSRTSFGSSGRADLTKLTSIHLRLRSRYEGAVRIMDRRIRASGQNPSYIPVLGRRNPPVGQRVVHDALWLPSCVEEGHRHEEE